VNAINKIVFLCFFSSFHFLNVDCQTVDNVRIERIGDVVKIRYILLNSNPDQRFNVKVYCSISEEVRFEPESITGDIGEDIPGGRSEYTVLWDVLEDVEELISAEFFVKAVLNDGSTGIQIDWSKPETYGFLATAVGPNNLQGGVRLLLQEKWGVSCALLAGAKKYRNEDHPGEGDRYMAFTASIDATRQIIQDSTYRMLLFSGLAIATEENSTGGASLIECGPELGLVLEMKRISLFINISYVKFLLSSTSIEPYPTYFLSFGIGLRPR
jgi:hypothetical protein